MSSRLSREVALRDRLYALIQGADEPWEALCLDIYQWQYEHCEHYRQYCERAGVVDVERWYQVPPVPVKAFKTMNFRSFPSDQTIRTFLTSGTSTGDHGHHHFNDLSLYRAASMRAFKKAMLPDTLRLPIFSVIPGINVAPESSLSQMVQWVYEDFWCEDEHINALEDIKAPTLILGTAFALADLFEQKRGLRLPEGTRIMETGGFKGRRREIRRSELHAMYKSAGIESAWVVGEYGMTELSSQWYDGVAGTITPGPDERVYTPAPWARTRVVDPMTMVDVEPGQVGLLLHVDPINLGSVQSILTEDLGERVVDKHTGYTGFRYRGRAAGTMLRGCSLRSE